MLYAKTIEDLEILTRLNLNAGLDELMLEGSQVVTIAGQVALA